jgi:hypothetical protein
MATTVSIGSIDLVCDPDDLIFGGRKRGAVLRCIDGSTVIQDRGFNPGDQTIQLKGRTPSLSVIQSLYSFYRSTGSSYAYADDRGNSLTVVFTPGGESFVVRPIKGSSLAYEYQISLTVISGTIIDAPVG